MAAENDPKDEGDSWTSVDSSMDADGKLTAQAAPKPESPRTRRCPICGESLAAPVSARIYSAGTVRSLDTSAALDCPRCAVDLADRPTKKYTPQPVLQDEPPVQEEPPPPVEPKPPTRRTLALAAILGVLGLGAAGIVGSRFWPRSDPVPATIDHPALTIESDPPGAAVEINGESVGDTPLRMGNFYPAQQLKVTLTLRGYRPWIGRFTGGKREAIVAKLRRR